MEKYQDGGADSEVLIELHYLPCLAYFTAIQPFDTIWLEAAENYQKQSYRNRCYVLTANGTERLTIPVLEGTHRQPVRDVGIDNRQPWGERQWRTIETAYRKAPFFEYYAPDLEAVLQKDHRRLFDLNQEMLTICLKWLGWKKKIKFTEVFEKEANEGVTDLRGWISPRGADKSGSVYQPFLYMQNFGTEFVPNLSIIDLFFCQGPLAKEILEASFRK
ncbi:WbqC family protein [Tellurirhabdus rosea]|uniref:WbqC family protein n=1 Tax=Tellurirhabdus rosea TaxID=2674997 RepID=UPI00224DC41F|nr:WbqC family protein [Tellurirhabdus rosea]